MKTAEKKRKVVINRRVKSRRISRRCSIRRNY